MKNPKIKIVLTLILIGISLFLYQEFNKNKINKDRQNQIKLSNLIFCVEKEHLSSLREFYSLCGVNNEKGCPFMNALNASFDGKYQEKKNECLDRFYYK